MRGRSCCSDVELLPDACGASPVTSYEDPTDRTTRSLAVEGEMSVSTDIREHDRPQTARRLSIDYGAIRFRIRSRSASLELPPGDEEFLRSCDAAETTPPMMTCDVVLEAASAGEDLPPVSERLPRWTFEESGGTLEFAFCRAMLRTTAEGGVQVRASTDGTPFTTSSLLSALTAAMVQRAGGLVLHATGIELDGKGILFVGPSGAGKTTAADLCHGARWIARDRAVVLPTSQGVRVWGLVGGTPGTLERSERHHVPLSAVLRVHQGREDPTLDWCDSVRAAFLLRESTFSGLGVPEPSCWSAIDRLREAARVGEVFTVLGRPLVPLLRSSLS